MDLPEYNGFTMIAIFVDRMTEMVHFAACKKEVTALEYAKIFIDTRHGPRIPFFRPCPSVHSLMGESIRRFPF